MWRAGQIRRWRSGVAHFGGMQLTPNGAVMDRTSCQQERRPARWRFRARATKIQHCPAIRFHPVAEIACTTQARSLHLALEAINYSAEQSTKISSEQTDTSLDNKNI